MIRPERFGDPRLRCPRGIKQEVQRRAQELIDSTLKARHIEPPPKKTQFNYLTDIHSEMARSLLLLLLEILFPRAQRAFCFVRSEVCETSVRREWAI